MRVAVRIVMLCTVLAAGRATGAAGELERLRESFESALKATEKEHRAKRAGLPEEYGEWLATARKQHQMAGELEPLLAVRAEDERYAREKTVPAMTAGVAPAVVALRKRYHERLAQADTWRKKRVLDPAARLNAQICDPKWSS